ncbi:MAG: ATP-binding response regulator [Thermoplasmatota archaeon]
MTAPRTYTTLIADDVAALRNLVRLALEGSGRFKVVAEATTGREAIDRARDTQPALVLLDLSMPEMDGLEALPHILRAAPDARVVVLSGFNHVRLAPLAKRIGASAYLEKGLEPAQLVSALLEVLEPGGDAPIASGATPPAVLPFAPLENASLPPPPGDPMARRALVLDGNPASASRLVTLLSGSRAAPFVATACASLDEAARRIGDGTEVVLVNPLTLGLKPDEALIHLLTVAPTLPFVTVTDTVNGFAARALRLGVEDCISLENLDGEVLGRTLLYAIERRRATEARRQVRDQADELARLRRMEELKTQFFNAAAHELGTPLTPIKLQIHVLKGMLADGTSPIERKAVEVLERNVERLSKLTQDLLDVARLQGGHLGLHTHPMDLHRVVEETVDAFAPLAASQGVDLTATCPPNEVVDGDAKRLGQVLFNLVTNALKFTPRGGHVTVDCEEGPAECTVRVHDTGIGLRPDQIGRLFQPFSQVLDESQPVGVGTGLGLFVSRGIIELHGGRLWCESPGAGRGSTFAFVLPRLAGRSAAVAA